jgi:hypothetical protein
LLTVPHSQAGELRGQVVDAAIDQPLAARIFHQRLDDGTFHLVRVASCPAAVPYDRRNWVNTRSYEILTCVGGVPFVAEK